MLIISWFVKCISMVLLSLFFYCQPLILLCWIYWKGKSWRIFWGDTMTNWLTDGGGDTHKYKIVICPSVNRGRSSRGCGRIWARVICPSVNRGRSSCCPVAINLSFNWKSWRIFGGGGHHDSLTDWRRLGHTQIWDRYSTKTNIFNNLQIPRSIWKDGPA